MASTKEALNAYLQQLHEDIAEMLEQTVQSHTRLIQMQCQILARIEFSAAVLLQQGEESDEPA